jgi:hypothetical protein
MHFYMHSYLHKILFLKKKWVLHIVINPLFEITSRRFWWWWEERNTNTLKKTVNDDYIENIKSKCYNRNYLSWLLFIPTPMEWTGGLRARPVPPTICIMVQTYVGLTIYVAFA